MKKKNSKNGEGDFLCFSMYITYREKLGEGTSWAEEKLGFVSSRKKPRLRPASRKEEKERKSRTGSMLHEKRQGGSAGLRRKAHTLPLRQKKKKAGKVRKKRYEYPYHLSLQRGKREQHIPGEKKKISRPHDYEKGA